MAGSANAGAARRRAARAATAIRFSIDIRSPEGRNNFSPATAVRTLRSTDSANFSRSRCRIRAVLKARAEELSPPAPAKGVYSDAAEGQSASVSNPTLLRIDVRFGSRLCENAAVAARGRFLFRREVSQDHSGPDRLDQRLRTEHGDHPFQIVGQDVEA